MYNFDTRAFEAAPDIDALDDERIVQFFAQRLNVVEFVTVDDL